MRYIVKAGNEATGYQASEGCLTGKLSAVRYKYGKGLFPQSEPCWWQLLKKTSNLRIHSPLRGEGRLTEIHYVETLNSLVLEDALF